MANPNYPVNVPADTWTKVATNVTTGRVWKKSTKPNLYLQTYRLTGEAAPTIEAEGVPMFIDSIDSEEISNPVGIDVYVFPVGDAGVLRVDI